MKISFLPVPFDSHFFGVVVGQFQDLVAESKEQ